MGKAKSLISNLEDKFKALGNALNQYSITGAPAEATVSSTQTGKFAISVTSLSSSQIVSSKGTVASGALGYAGTITINNGSYDSSNNFTNTNSGTPITIEAKDTLSVIAKKINDSNSGVHANIINGKDGQHLSFSGSVGSENGFEIQTQDSDNTGLSFFNYNQANSANFNNISQAKDGVATINGIDVFSADNNFKANDNFSFKATKEFASQTITVAKDDSTIANGLKEFVTAYNSATTTLKSMDVDNQFKTFTNKLRTVLGQGDYENSISHIGLSFDKNGVMSFDEAKYKKYNETNVNNSHLKDLLDNKFGKSSKGLDLLDNTTESNGFLDDKITSLNVKNKRVIDNISNNQDILSNQTLSYQLQFAKMDQYLSNIQSSSNAVSALVNQLSTRA